MHGENMGEGTTVACDGIENSKWGGDLIVWFEMRAESPSEKEK